MRPTKLNAETQKRVCDALRAGNTRAAAAEYAGIAENTFYNWLARGEQAKSGKFLEFLRAVKKAEADCEVRNVGIIQQNAAKTWQAAAWWLERRRPNDWGRKDRVDVTSDDEPITNVVVSIVRAPEPEGEGDDGS